MPRKPSNITPRKREIQRSEPLTPHELQRLDQIQSLELINSVDLPELNRIAEMAAYAMRAPTVLISLVAQTQQHFLARVNFPLEQTSRATSICAHTIQQDNVLEVLDLTQDLRFQSNPLVTGPPYIRAYAGAPLVTEAGYALGAMCLIDYVPRRFDEDAHKHLKACAALVVDQLRLRRSIGRIDGVSGLPNRQQMLADLAALENVCDQDAIFCLTEVLDAQSVHFLSQSMGVNAIDALARETGARVASALPRGARLYHVAVARFAFILPGADVAKAHRQINLLLDVFRSAFDAKGVYLKPSCRIGVVPFIHKEWQDVSRKGILTLQHALEQEWNWAVYDWHYDQQLQRRYRLAADAPQALASGDFFLLYQPCVDLVNGKVIKAEALLRWRHHELGLLSPDEFIPVLEKTALMPQLTSWVIDAALEQMAQWNAAGLFTKVAINVSPTDFGEGTLLTKVRESFLRHSVMPTQLEIEITEGEWLSGGAEAVKQLQDLRKMGIGLYIDDFGAGFSNFGYLPRLPIDGIKIDRTLVSGSEDEGKQASVVQTIIRMAHSLQLLVVAEGIETERDALRLHSWGCDQGQGFYFSRPVSATSLVPST